MKYITYAAIIGIAYYIIRRIEDYFDGLEGRIYDIEERVGLKGEKRWEKP